MVPNEVKQIKRKLWSQNSSLDILSLPRWMSSQMLFNRKDWGHPVSSGPHGPTPWEGVTIVPCNQIQWCMMTKLQHWGPLSTGGKTEEKDSAQGQIYGGAGVGFSPWGFSEARPGPVILVSGSRETGRQRAAKAAWLHRALPLSTSP